MSYYAQRMGLSFKFLCVLRLGIDCNNIVIIDCARSASIGLLICFFCPININLDLDNLFYSIIVCRRTPARYRSI